MHLYALASIQIHRGGRDVPEQDNSIVLNEELNLPLYY